MGLKCNEGRGGEEEEEEEKEVEEEEELSTIAVGPTEQQ